MAIHLSPSPPASASVSSFPKAAQMMGNLIRTISYIGYIVGELLSTPPDADVVAPEAEAEAEAASSATEAAGTCFTPSPSPSPTPTMMEVISSSLVPHLLPPIIVGVIVGVIVGALVHQLKVSMTNMEANVYSTLLDVHGRIATMEASMKVMQEAGGSKGSRSALYESDNDLLRDILQRLIAIERAVDTELLRNDKRKIVEIALEEILHSSTNA